MYLQPDVALSEQAGEVASPVASCPTETLLEELGVVFQGSLDLAFWMILHVHLVLVVDQPTGNEVVIVSVELILTKEPLLVGETVGEVRVLQNVGTISASASRNASHPAIHVAGSSTIEVATLEIQGTKEAVDTLAEGRVLRSSKSLAGNNTTIQLVLEGSKNPLKQLGRPVDIIISEDNDLSLDLGDSTSHLSSLVGLLDGHAAETTLLTSRHLCNGVLSLA